MVIGSNESGFASCVELGFKDYKDMIIVRDANQLSWVFDYGQVMGLQRDIQWTIIEGFPDYH